MAGFKHIEFKWKDIQQTAKNMASQRQYLFADHIGSKIGEMTFKKACEIVEETCEVVSAKDWLERRTGIHYVTGNLFASMGFLVTRNAGDRFMRSRYYAPYNRSGLGRPTRKGLGKGERYNLPYYYGGEGAYKLIEGVLVPPYVGKMNASGLYGPTERDKFIRYMTTSKQKGSNFYQIVCFVAMPYANYVGSIHNTNVTIEMFKEVQQSMKGAMNF